MLKGSRWMEDQDIGIPTKGSPSLGSIRFQCHWGALPVSLGALPMTLGALPMTLGVLPITEYSQ
jgi:hypothetical protein